MSFLKRKSAVFARWEDAVSIPPDQMMLLQRAARQEPPLHALFTGKPGLGKTLLARAYASNGGKRSYVELHASRDLSTGLLVAAIRQNMPVLLDDIHLLNPQALAVLYPVVQPAGQRLVQEGRKVYQVHTAVVATSNNALPDALTSRFPVRVHMEPYSADAILRILRSKYPNAQQDALEEVARYARGVPREALTLLETASALGAITVATVQLAAMGRGFMPGLYFKRQELEYMRILGESEKPVSAQVLKARIGADVDEVEEYLVQHGYVQRTPRGRTLTSAGWLLLNQLEGGDSKDE